MRCFNCNADNHVSEFCPEPQKYTRCGHCSNVCLNQSAHKIWCRTPEFVSVDLFPEREKIVEQIAQAEHAVVDNAPIVERECEISVPAVKDEPLVGANQIKIAFKDVRGVRVSENGIETFIVENAVHGGAGIVIKKVFPLFPEKQVYKLLWAPNESKTILISKRDPNSNVIKLMKIFVGVKCGRINAYYHFADDGFVHYNVNEKQSTIGHFDCELMIIPDDHFSIRVQWLNVRFQFEVNGTDVKLRGCVRI